MHIVSDVLAIDHVIVVVDDLDAAALRFDERWGLASVVGGVHPGHGTANRIVPLGDDYLELVAVVDRHEAAASPFGSWVQRRVVDAGDVPAALCVRSDDIDAVARRTQRALLPMSRARPDGVRLDWHLVGLDAAVTEGLPFFITWHVADGDHPGRASIEHRCAAVGLEWVELGGDIDQLAAWLGPNELPLRHVEGDPGPRRVAVRLRDGAPIVIG